MPPPWKMPNAVATGNTINGVSREAKDSHVDNLLEGQNATGTWMQSMQAKQRGTSNFDNGDATFQRSKRTHSDEGNQVKISFWPSSASEDDLKDLFSQVGAINRARVLPPRDGRDITLCFLTFSTDEEARNAVGQLNNHEIEGRRIRVEIDDKGNGVAQGKFSHANGNISSIKSKQIKIFSWPASLGEEDLRSLFMTTGDIHRVKVLPAREGRDTTLGFVTFSNCDEAEIAVRQFDGHEIEGKMLKVHPDEKSAAGGGLQSQASDESRSKRNQIKILSCPSSASEDDLKDLFCSAGRIQRVKVLPAREGRDITLAFVTYSCDEEAVAAIEKFDNYELMGKSLRVSVNEQNNSARNSQPQNDEATPSNLMNQSKPWIASSETNGSLAAGEPWSNSSSSFPKPWASQGGRSVKDERLVETQSRGFTMEKSRDGGIFIEDGEMNDDLSFKPARAPVIYVPPPPPEEESEIFDNTCHQGINFEQYENIPFEVTGRDPPTRISTFEEANLHQVCLENLRRAKYEKPTPVQKNVLPIVLFGRDVMACAQTGSGKTAAYLLPLITNLLKNRVEEAGPCESANPNALIIAPTRELAVQIFLETRKFAYGSKLRTVVIYGGVSVSHQIGKLCDGCNILVATPGRLNDFIGRGRVSLSEVEVLILDEADRMLDMGFGPTIKRIIQVESMKPKESRQTLMLSATFPERIQEIAAEYLRDDYIFVTVGRLGGASTDIMQTILEMPSSEKRAKLEEILLESGGDRILVFVETKRSADFLASFLSQRNFPTTSISSDRSQEEREYALKDFRAGKAPVLVATAVAARGLDIPDVKQVINFDLPSDLDEYVHRIGRTGRIGNQGRAVAFFDRNKDQKLARGLVKVLSESNQEVPEWLEEIAMSAVGTGYGPAGGQFSSRDSRQSNGGLRSNRVNDLSRSYKDEKSQYDAVSKSQAAPLPSAGSNAIAGRNAIAGSNATADDDEMWC